MIFWRYRVNRRAGLAGLGDEPCGMDFEIRQLTAEDKPAHRALMALAFEHGRVPTPEAANADESEDEGGDDWGLFAGGRLRSSLTIRPFQVHWGLDTVLSMGGIAGVASSPEARGAGHVNALLRHALATMREQGQVISALYPFSWSFYREFGWDWVGERREITLPLEHLPKFPASRGMAERVDGEGAKERLAATYTTFARRYRGMFTSESHQWKPIEPRDGRQAYAFQFPPTGEYFTWRYQADDKSGRIGHWMAWTPEGCHALLSVLHYLANQCETAEVAVPVDTLFPHFVMHWDLKTTVRPVFMGRVVDVAGALTGLPAPASATGSLMIRIWDEHAPWNAGVWRVASDGSRISCERVEDTGGRMLLEMDIQAFSQAFWGTPSLASLRAAGRVAVRDEMAFDWLSMLLPSAPVFTMDFF